LLRLLAITVETKTPYLLIPTEVARDSGMMSPAIPI
jgi:hypothetical protein